jgi:ethanolamine ammonia-lyase large subunit
MGERGVLGIRIQPNHPTDDIAGLLYGCGDAVIGANPASDGVESTSAILRALNRLVTTLKIPTQTCCLAHISTQLAALSHGAPIDLLFQSVGTEGTNRSFGITLEMLSEGRERIIEHHRQRQEVTWKGDDVMYFETGQGSALSAEAHRGVDQVTLEARAYGVARAFHPFLVNSVVGFIGPEYLFDERQIIRAGLEDHFMGKLLGRPHGVRCLLHKPCRSGPKFRGQSSAPAGSGRMQLFMGVPCGDDVMLNYQSTSYHDAIGVRRIFNQRPAPEFLKWLEEAGIYRDGEPAKFNEPVRRQLMKGLEWSLEDIQ